MESNWKGYLSALGKQKIPQTTLDTKPFETTEGNTTSSGFIEWKPPIDQSKHDPMSLKWQGVNSSENARMTSIYKPVFMPVNNKK